MDDHVPSRKDVTLTITETCNLNCVYCYEEHKSRNEMAFETAKRIIDYELSVNDGTNQLTIDFFGGEPFMNFELIKRICNYTWSKDWPKQYIFFATTNGTLIHGEIEEWVSTNKDRFWLGLSIDGNEYMQNINRCNSFSQIDLDYFIREWPDQAVKMTISRETLPYLAEGCIFLHEKGFKVTCNLAYGLDWSSADSLKTLSDQLMKLIDCYEVTPVNLEKSTKLPHQNMQNLQRYMKGTKTCRYRHWPVCYTRIGYRRQMVLRQLCHLWPWIESFIRRHNQIAGS